MTYIADGDSHERSLQCLHLFLVGPERENDSLTHSAPFDFLGAALRSKFLWSNPLPLHSEFLRHPKGLRSRDAKGKPQGSPEGTPTIFCFFVFVERGEGSSLLRQSLHTSRCLFQVGLKRKQKRESQWICQACGQQSWSRAAATSEATSCRATFAR